MAVDETEASPFVCIATLEGGLQLRTEHLRAAAIARGVDDRRPRAIPRATPREDARVAKMKGRARQRAHDRDSKRRHARV